MNQATPVTPPAYGYIRWRSKLTGKEEGGTAPIADPGIVVSILNNKFPNLHHWFIPARSTPSRYLFVSCLKQLWNPGKKRSRYH